MDTTSVRSDRLIQRDGFLSGDGVCQMRRIFAADYTLASKFVKYYPSLKMCTMLRRHIYISLGASHKNSNQ